MGEGKACHTSGRFAVVFQSHSVLESLYNPFLVSPCCKHGGHCALAPKARALLRLVMALPDSQNCPPRAVLPVADVPTRPWPAPALLPPPAAPKYSGQGRTFFRAFCVGQTDTPPSTIPQASPYAPQTARSISRPSTPASGLPSWMPMPHGSTYTAANPANTLFTSVCT